MTLHVSSPSCSTRRFTRQKKKRRESRQQTPCRTAPFAVMRPQRSWRSANVVATEV